MSVDSILTLACFYLSKDVFSDVVGDVEVWMRERERAQQRSEEFEEFHLVPALRE
jgi:hypothetical protein